MSDIERKLKQLHGITVERLDSLRPLFTVLVKIPWDANVGLKSWGMIDLLIYEGEKEKRRKIGTWIRTKN